MARLTEDKIFKPPSVHDPVSYLGISLALAWLRLIELMTSMVDIVTFFKLQMCPRRLHMLALYFPIWDVSAS